MQITIRAQIKVIQYYIVAHTLTNQAKNDFIHFQSFPKDFWILTAAFIGTHIVIKNITTPVEGIISKLYPPTFDSFKYILPLVAIGVIQ